MESNPKVQINNPRQDLVCRGLQILDDDGIHDAFTTRLTYYFFPTCYFTLLKQCAQKSTAGISFTKIGIFIILKICLLLVKQLLDFYRAPLSVAKNKNPEYTASLFALHSLWVTLE